MADRYIPQITPPVINLNGASKDSLLNNHLTVLNYLRVAAKAMHDVFPHGRDFQTAPNGTGTRARQEVLLRCIKIEELIVDYEALVLAIADQK